MLLENTNLWLAVGRVGTSTVASTDVVRLICAPSAQDAERQFRYSFLDVASVIEVTISEVTYLDVPPEFE